MTVNQLIELLESIKDRNLPIYFCPNDDPWFQKPTQATPVDHINFHRDWIALIGEKP